MCTFKFFASAALVTSAFAFIAPVAHANVASDAGQNVAESSVEQAGKVTPRTINSARAIDAHWEEVRVNIAATTPDRPSFDLRLTLPTPWHPTLLRNARKTWFCLESRNLRSTGSRTSVVRLWYPAPLCRVLSPTDSNHANGDPT